MEPAKDGKIDEAERFIKHFAHYRQKITGKTRFLALCQLILLGLLGYEALLTKEMRDKYATPPPSVNIVLCRFICAIFLHIAMADELNQGLTFMKYALNHSWKFERWFAAYSAGMGQMFVLVMVEFVNLAVLLTNPTIMETIMNFLALVIIVNFDDFYFDTVKEELLCKLITEKETELHDKVLTLEALTTIETTSSEHARFKIDANLRKQTEGGSGVDGANGA